MSFEERKSIKTFQAERHVSRVVGIGLLVQGSFLPASAGLASKVLPALVALLFWGLLTIQNVAQLVSLLKGQTIKSKEANDGLCV